MSEPLVTCVMLSSRGREKLGARAIAGFVAQTYQNRQLIVFPSDGRSIGALRNAAVEQASGEIIAHMDDDDLSMPNRLAEQVALLQAGEAAGVECVGYNEAVFWDERNVKVFFPQLEVSQSGRFQRGSPEYSGGEAWIYRYANHAYALGTSLCYWRRAWERKPFDDINHGEDERFRLAHRTVGVSGIGSAESRGFATASGAEFGGFYIEPRLIASIHAGNTSKFDPAANVSTCKRAPEFDQFCREAMKL